MTRYFDAARIEELGVPFDIENGDFTTLNNCQILVCAFTAHDEEIGAWRGTQSVDNEAELAYCLDTSANDRRDIAFYTMPVDLLADCRNRGRVPLLYTAA